jgi:hypothetical protein
MKRSCAPPARQPWVLGLIALVLVSAPGAARGGAQSTAKDPKAIAVIEAAVAALGGERYLGLKAIESRGVYTPFVQGSRGLPIEFVDTFVYPDSERTEFGKKKSRVVQANAGGTGWKFDAIREVLADQTEEELRNFRESSRATLENLLRSALRDPTVAVASLGRTEVAPRQRVDHVAIDYADKVRIEVSFDITSHLPASVKFREGGGLVTGAPVEIRFHSFVDHGGIKIARIVDFYRDGFQTGRAVTEEAIINPSVAASHFTKPASAKDVK